MINVFKKRTRLYALTTSAFVFLQGVNVSIGSSTGGTSNPISGGVTTSLLGGGTNSATLSGGPGASAGVSVVRGPSVDAVHAYMKGRCYGEFDEGKGEYVGSILGTVGSIFCKDGGTHVIVGSQAGTEIKVTELGENAVRAEGTPILYVSGTGGIGPSNRDSVRTTLLPGSFNKGEPVTFRKTTVKLSDVTLKYEGNGVASPEVSSNEGVGFGWGSTVFAKDGTIELLNISIDGFPAGLAASVRGSISMEGGMINGSPLGGTVPDGASNRGSAVSVKEGGKIGLSGISINGFPTGLEASVRGRISLKGGTINSSRVGITARDDSRISLEHVLVEVGGGSQSNVPDSGVMGLSSSDGSQITMKSGLLTFLKGGTGASVQNGSFIRLEDFVVNIKEKGDSEASRVARNAVSDVAPGSNLFLLMDSYFSLNKGSFSGSDVAVLRVNDRNKLARPVSNIKKPQNPLTHQMSSSASESAASVLSGRAFSSLVSTTIKSSQITATGNSYGIYFDGGNVTEQSGASPTQQAKVDMILLGQTNFSVPDSVAILGNNLNGDVFVENRSTLSGDLLLKATKSSNLSVFVHNSVVSGGASVDGTSSAKLFLLDKAEWRLTKSKKNSTSPEQDSLTSSLSYLSLSKGSAIRFVPSKDGGRGYQTLRIGKGNGTVYNVSATTNENRGEDSAKIYFSANLSTGSRGQQVSDRLLIHGNVEGKTTVFVSDSQQLQSYGQKDGSGSRKSINPLFQSFSLIQVHGNASINSFKLKGVYVTRNGMPYQYVLKAYKNSNSSSIQYFDDKLDKSSFWDFRLENVLQGLERSESGARGGIVESSLKENITSILGETVPLTSLNLSNDIWFKSQVKENINNHKNDVKGRVEGIKERVKERIEAIKELKKVRAEERTRAEASTESSTDSEVSEVLTNVESGPSGTEGLPEVSETSKINSSLSSTTKGTVPPEERGDSSVPSESNDIEEPSIEGPSATSISMPPVSTLSNEVSGRLEGEVQPNNGRNEAVRPALGQPRSFQEDGGLTILSNSDSIMIQEATGGRDVSPPKEVVQPKEENETHTAAEKVLASQAGAAPSDSALSDKMVSRTKPSEQRPRGRVLIITQGATSKDSLKSPVASVEGLEDVSSECNSIQGDVRGVETVSCVNLRLEAADQSQHSVHAGKDGAIIKLKGSIIIGAGSDNIGTASNAASAVLAEKNAEVVLENKSTIQSSVVGIEAKNGGKVTMADGTVNASYMGALAGSGSSVNLSNTEIHVTGDSAIAGLASKAGEIVMDSGVITLTNGVAVKSESGGRIALNKVDITAKKGQNKSDEMLGRSVFLVTNNASVEFTNGNVTTDATALWIKESGDAVEVSTSRRRRSAEVRPSLNHANIEDSTIRVEGDGAYGIYFDGAGQKGNHKQIAASQQEKTPIRVTGAISLKRTNFEVVNGIAIYGNNSGGQISLEEGTVLSGDLLLKAENNSNISVLVDHSIIRGGIRVNKDSYAKLDLINGSGWILKRSMQKDLGAPDLRCVDSCVSSVRLVNSAIDFSPSESGGKYQTLHIGNGKGTVYEAQGDAIIHLNARLNPHDSSGQQVTDQLVIHGDVSGKTKIHVRGDAGNVANGQENAKIAHSVSIIQVYGQAEKDSFQLDGDYVALRNSPYKYTLRGYGPEATSKQGHVQQKIVKDGGEFWNFRLENQYVKSTTSVVKSSVPGRFVRAVVPQVPTYLLLPNSVFHTGLMDINHQSKQLETLRMTSTGMVEVRENPALYLRGYGGRYRYASDLSLLEYGYDGDFDYRGVEAGVLLKTIENTDSALSFGVMGTYGKLSLQPVDVALSQKSAFDKWTATVYGSMQHNVGFYVDGLLSYGLFKGDVLTLARGKTATLKGNPLNVSLIAGQTIATGYKGFVFDPQVQVVYQHLQFDKARDIDNFNIEMGNLDQWVARVGGRLTKNPTGSEGVNAVAFYGKLYFAHGFGEKQSVQFKDTFKLGAFGSSLEAGVGFNVKLLPQFSLHADILYQHKLNKAGFSGASFSGGVRYQF
ncbi:autotransporter family protein [Bartonella raoultii]|uniref:autotransporter family protein n=1 Tax=Bartonella raoultii TaxID=1457020 RepID=UPI001FED5E01|nr:autotransporter outer membrane beta-barrel domain-containing protein [Bartonella raoultii]